MRSVLTVIATLAATATWLVSGEAQPVSAATNEGVITGTVTSSDGPEAGAGVWVIAETDQLETVFRKIVVTDDEGKFLLPELPAATFNVWVRGYGLVDSTPVSIRWHGDGAPGLRLHEWAAR